MGLENFQDLNLSDGVQYFMRVKCIHNSGKLLPQDLLDKQTTFKVDTEFALKLEKEYKFQIYLIEPSKHRMSLNLRFSQTSG